MKKCIKCAFTFCRSKKLYFKLYECQPNVYVLKFGHNIKRIK